MPKTSHYKILLSEAERKELERIANKYTAPYYIVVRAKAVLMAAQGYENKIIGERLVLHLISSMTYYYAASAERFEYIEIFIINADKSFFVNFHSKGFAIFSYLFWKLIMFLVKSSKVGK